MGKQSEKPQILRIRVGVVSDNRELSKLFYPQITQIDADLCRGDACVALMEFPLPLREAAFAPISSRQGACLKITTERTENTKEKPNETNLTAGVRPQEVLICGLFSGGC